MVLRLLPLYLLLTTAILPTTRAASGQKFCETDRRICVTGFCPIEECLSCRDKAVCETSNPNEVVPRKLQPYMHHLKLTYTGPDTELTPDMFDYFPSLKEIEISGNIASIAPNTFVKQWNLKWLTISNGKLKRLPSQLFNSSKKLLYLKVPKNEFQEIPTNIFPQIPNIVRMDFSYNPLDGCQNATINPELGMLKHLEELRLSGYGKSVELCRNISKDYLLPIQHIKVLDLSKSLLFFGDQRILSPLTKLHDLAIDNLSPYKECPAKAEEMFQNLPQSLSNLAMRNWATMSYTNGSCVLDDKALTGLKKLKKLSVLDCRYGDKLFGNVLTPSTLSGLSKLRTVNLQWCGIAVVDSGAFNLIPMVKDIELSGNLLGARVLELYTGKQPADVRTLNLNLVGINNPTYDACNLLLAFPKLQLLYLSGNFLETIPDFGFSKNVSSAITSLTLNDNKIKQLSPDDGEKLCKVMHSLVIFEAEKNELSDITGLSRCPLLKRVRLADNFLGKNEQSNFRALSQLHKLSDLDLSGNKLRHLPPELFTNLRDLRTLILGNNEIYSLSDTTFESTPLLEVLDLSSNSLPIFNASIVSSGLSQIRHLYLESNQITTLPPDLLQLFDNMLLLSNLGLMGNPLTCYCDSHFINWVLNSSIIPDVKYLTCSTPDSPDVTNSVASFKPNHFRCYVRKPLIDSGIVLAGVVVSLLLALPCYKYRWFVTHPKVVARAIAEKLNEVEFDERCEYDAFISYDSSSDSVSQWVVEKLIPAIESVSDGETSTKSNLKLYIADRDSAVGSPKYTEKCRAIEASRKVIILLSNSYLANPACLNEADLVACYEMVDGEHCYQLNRILVVILEELNEEAIRFPLTSLLTQNVIHIVDNEARMRRIWKSVRRFIAKPEYIFRKKRKQRSALQDISETDRLIQ